MTRYAHLPLGLADAAATAAAERAGRRSSLSIGGTSTVVAREARISIVP